MKLYVIVLVGLAICLTQNSFAEDKAPPLPLPEQIAKLPFKLEAEFGKPLKVIFKDGREATLKTQRPPLMQFKLDTAIPDFTCGRVSLPKQHLPKNCYINAEFKPTKFRLVWTKHSDPKKLNQILKCKEYDREENCYDQTELATNFNIDIAEIAKYYKFTRPALTCDNLSLGRNVKAGDELQAYQWVSNGTNYSPELGGSEKASATFAEDFTVRYTSANSFEFHNLPSEKYFAIQLLFSDLGSAKAIDFINPQAPNELCHMQMKVVVNQDDFQRLVGLIDQVGRKGDQPLIFDSYVEKIILEQYFINKTLREANLDKWILYAAAMRLIDRKGYESNAKDLRLDYRDPQ
jgi:hypothetical protein